MTRDDALTLCRTYFSTRRRDVSLHEYIRLKLSCTDRRAGDVVDLARDGRSWEQFVRSFEATPTTVSIPEVKP